jgi:hypothetical protein
LLFNLPLSLISGQDKKPITEILSNQYEFKMISSGNNFPNFNTERDFLREIVVLLHNGIALDDIRKYYSWDTKTFDSKLGILKNSDYIKTGTDGKLYSNVFVCSLADGEKISKHLGTIAIQIADSIQNRLNSVIQEVKKAEALKAYKFEDISLLILSDVLLDNWQINNVESDFLKSFRTLRHGKHYYASFQEKKKGTYSEAFEIYGNQMENSGSFTICRYGNRRYSPEVVGLNSELKKEYVSSLSVKRTSCPVIGEADNDQLQKIADSFKPTLLKILNNKREFIRKNYQESVYSKEISFEEYFIWIYHFIYTSVTDELIKRKVIKLPEKNVAFYILKND